MNETTTRGARLRRVLGHTAIYVAANLVAALALRVWDRRRATAPHGA